MHTEPMLREGALKGKVAIVTGGGSGLGRSMAKYFLELGAKVMITSRSQERMDKASAELHEETGGEVSGFAADVRKHIEVGNMLAATIEKYGQVDILVNNAAGNFVSPTERLSPRAFDTVVDIVLRGTYNCTLAVGNHMIEKGIKGCMLNIVTTYAWTGSGYVVPSAAAKAGVLAITRSLAVEWGRKYGIRLNAIAPGPFPTPGAFERLFPPAMRKLGIDPEGRIPLGRFGDHQELANLAAYLVSDFASYVNGEVVTIDGGEWLSGAGEFNDFHKVPEEMWDGIEQQVRKAKT